ncbi:hypothetical protein AAC387_Pa06g1441 [Persea americana]
MKAAIREEVRNEVRTEMRAELRAKLTELEARLSQSRGPIASDPPPTTQAPDTGSGHRARHDLVGEGSHDPSGSTDPDQVLSPTLPRRRRRIKHFKRLSQLLNPSGMPEMALEPSESAQERTSS